MTEAAPTLSRRSLGRAATAAAAVALGCRPGLADTSEVNAPRHYPVRAFGRTLECRVNLDDDRGPVDERLFGTNLEWFNEGGGLSSPDPNLRRTLVDLAREQKLRVARYPGGTLADYYNWRDGTGAVAARPVRRHPTDSGRSANGFGSPEFFRFLRETGAEGMITLNAGTGTAKDAAAWVAYANQPGHAGRAADGTPHPAGIKLWEVGNELYLPGNPGERKITQTPEAYAANFLSFAEAVRSVDPSVTMLAIGTLKSHRGPDSPFPHWNDVLLAKAAAKVDLLAVHNAYFPVLYNTKQPSIDEVYPALWAAPEAVARGLEELSKQIDHYEPGGRIGIAITEWGALFSVPTLDPFWVDHVKTVGSAVYLARMLQVFVANPRVRVGNYFKFTDRSFMGWVAYDGQPKVPYWVFRLFAETTGDRRIAADLDSPTFNAPAIGLVSAASGVADVTVVATRRTARADAAINFVNRSMTTAYEIRIGFGDVTSPEIGQVRSVSGPEPTAHDGRDIPPELPMRPAFEPYSTAPPGSIRIETKPWAKGQTLSLPPFSVTTLVLQTKTRA